MTRLWITLYLVTSTRSVRWLKILLHPLRQKIAPVDRINLLLNGFGVGSDFSYFRISTMPSTTSFSPLRPTSPSRGWNPTTTLAICRCIPACRGSVVTTTSSMSSIFSISMAIRVVGNGRVERVDPLAQISKGPDVMRLRPQRQDIAADVRVRLRDRVRDHLQGHVVPSHQLVVEQDLILFDSTAEARHIDHAGYRLQGAVEHPVLHRLELIQRVASPFRT